MNENSQISSYGNNYVEVKIIFTKITLASDYLVNLTLHWRCSMPTRLCWKLGISIGKTFKFKMLGRSSKKVAKLVIASLMFLLIKSSLFLITKSSFPLLAMKNGIQKVNMDKRISADKKARILIFKQLKLQ